MVTIYSYKNLSYKGIHIQDPYKKYCHITKNDSLTVIGYTVKKDLENRTAGDKVLLWGCELSCGCERAASPDSELRIIRKMYPFKPFHVVACHNFITINASGDNDTFRGDTCNVRI